MFGAYPIPETVVHGWVYSDLKYISKDFEVPLNELIAKYEAGLTGSDLLDKPMPDVSGEGLKERLSKIPYIKFSEKPINRNEGIVKSTKDVAVLCGYQKIRDLENDYGLAVNAVGSRMKRGWMLDDVLYQGRLTQSRARDFVFLGDVYHTIDEISQCWGIPIHVLFQFLKDGGREFKEGLLVAYLENEFVPRFG